MKYKCKRNYLDMFRKNNEYELYNSEDVNKHLIPYPDKQDIRSYFKDSNGKKVNIHWGLKDYEIELYFDKI